MIYRKDNYEFILSCNCHCGESLLFSTDKEFYENYGDYFYMVPLCYGTNKDKTSIIYNIKDSIIHMFNYLMGKKIYRIGICISKEDVEYMYKWFLKQKNIAIKNTLIPNQDSIESIFNNKEIIYRNNEIINIEIDKDFNDGKMISAEFCLYTSKNSYYKFKDKVKQLFREFRRNKYLLLEIYFNHVSFIHFCDYMIENLKGERNE